jgi:hypothetical protein
MKEDLCRLARLLYCTILYCRQCRKVEREDVFGDAAFSAKERERERERERESYRNSHTSCICTLY